MNNDKTISQIEAVEAWLQGKPVQWSYERRQEWIPEPNRTIWSKDHGYIPKTLTEGGYVYRLTPVPTLVPWTYESVPMELSWVRLKGDNVRFAVLQIRPGSVMIDCSWSYSDLFNQMEWYNPYSKSWMPCGTGQEAR